MVTLTFSETVSGFEAGVIVVANGTKGTFSTVTAGTKYTVMVTPVVGQTVSVSVPAGAASDAAGNDSIASDVLNVTAGSPASEFAAAASEVRTVVQADVQRSLTSTLASNRRLSNEARLRFMTSRTQMATGSSSGVASRNTVDFDIDGMAEVSGGNVTSNGTFFQQTGNFEGTYRRLFFGDFDVQHDTDTGATTATLSGKIAWEYMVSEDTMLGYHIGVEVGRSNIDGAFEGDQDRIGVSLGGYVVTALQDNLFADGFVSFGVGRNNLAMGNGTLDLQGNYLTQTVTFGASLTGVIQRGTYEIWPELAFTYGKTFIGDVSFTGQAYGLVDNDLSLNAGDVSVANLTLRPEFRVPVDGRAVSDSLSLFGFAPRVLCEQVQTTVTTSACGAGAEFSWIGMSEDGMTNATARVLVDRIGQTTVKSTEVV